nr:MAG TPA: hypothetical protein [Caudoviricetes sp.]
MTTQQCWSAAQEDESFASADSRRPAGSLPEFELQTQRDAEHRFKA